ncbi:MAG: glycosyltransferase family 4 protein [Pikeienuella sp.]
MSTWSGTPYFMAEALSGHLGSVVHLGPFSRLPLRFAKIVGQIGHRITGRTYWGYANRLRAAVHRAEARRRCRGAQPDLVVAAAASAVVASLPPEVPVIYSSDATFRLIQGYYPEFTNLSRNSRRMGEQMEQSALTRADLVILPSEWAARSAIEDYGTDPAKIHVIPFGANLIDPPSRREVLETAAPHRAPKLLFVGKEWHRKGGDVAVDTLHMLRAQGIQATLSLLGCRPEGVDPSTPGLEILGFLDKSDSAARARFERAFAEADFLLMPVRAECLGIVFAEAAAHSLPVLSTRTGGVSSMVSDGETGALLSPGATGEAFAARIREIMAEPGRHRAMRLAARARFEQLLNWDHWGARVAELAHQMLARRTGG